MRPEKKYLVEEASRHLDKSDFVFLADYRTVNVDEIAELRGNLSSEKAEFHVVKNSALRVAARERNLPDLEEWLAGPTAIVTGGENPSGVAKILRDFAKDKKKLELKTGVLGDRTLSKEEIEALADLPSLDVLRAQLLGLLSTPAQQLVRVLNGVPQGLLNVLQAQSQKEEAA